MRTKREMLIAKINELYQEIERLKKELIKETKNENSARNK